VIHKTDKLNIAVNFFDADCLVGKSHGKVLLPAAEMTRRS
jgi:hypothetical protein